MTGLAKSIPPSGKPRRRHDVRFTGALRGAAFFAVAVGDFTTAVGAFTTAVGLFFAAVRFATGRATGACFEVEGVFVAGLLAPDAFDEVAAFFAGVRFAGVVGRFAATFFAEALAVVLGAAFAAVEFAGDRVAVAFGGVLGAPLPEVA
jgi:hypothetical protein